MVLTLPVTATLPIAMPRIRCPHQNAVCSLGGWDDGTWWPYLENTREFAIAVLWRYIGKLSIAGILARLKRLQDAQR